jgi:Uma2 family endonuclease
MSSQPKHLYTPEEYLELERKAEYRSQYVRGEIFAMSGASRAHGVIVMNFSGAFWQHLKGRPCEAYATDMRVRVSAARMYTYPDLTIVCGEPQFADDQKDTLLNPVVLIEVLSPSTEGYDRGIKFGHYRTLPSLREYLAVAQDRAHIEHYVRQPDNRWLLSEYSSLDEALVLPSLELSIPLAEIYDKVQFAA